jgi:lysophospholipase L1-like esterase
MIKRTKKLIWYGLSLLGISCFILFIQPVIAQTAAPPAVTIAPPAPAKKLTKVVFFGSSTTVGIGATRGDRRWSSLLSRYLNWQEINEGLSGSTISVAQRNGKPAPVPSGLERWRNNVLSRHPDRVIMLYGVNDAFFQIPLGSPSERGTYQGDVTRMLTGMAKEFKPDQLIISNAQPNQATLDRREPYDRILQEASQQIGSHFIDAAHEAFPQSELAAYSADGLHLNNFGHAAFASYLANKMVDIGVATAPALSQGGNKFAELPMTALPGGFLRIDLQHPLTFGRIQTLAATWSAPGHARLAIMRPDGRGGYEAIYRTPVFEVKPGISQIQVPNWWVLDSDRLAVWTDDNCISEYQTSENSIGQLVVPQGHSLQDVAANSGEIIPQSLGIYTVFPLS